MSLQPSYLLIVATFIVLVLGSVRVLRREWRATRPPVYLVAALVLIWAVALALRLLLSPHTFLHEYYHVAETVSAYLSGEIAPQYGKAGPALYRFAGVVTGYPDDVRVIFVTNAVLASLAIPAVALFDLALTGMWARAICAAALLCVLPQHLRFSAAEDLFVPAITFGLWTLALFALYLRTRRLVDAVLCALALSLAMQARPEMLFFPALLVGLVLLVEPGAWRVLVSGRTLLALLVLVELLLPRFFELRQVLNEGAGPTPRLPELGHYLRNLVLLDAAVTPAVYWVLLAVGFVWGVRRRPGLMLWVLGVFVGYTAFSLSVFSNPPYNLRSQVLPMSFTVLIAAGAAPVWMDAWGPRRRLAIGLGCIGLVGLGMLIVGTRAGFVTELRDQQLQWTFLEHAVPALPETATLLTAVDVGGRNLDAFPQFLLVRAGKRYQMVDVRRAAAGDVVWPQAGDDLIYYQGMFCYFAFADDEPTPAPMTSPCLAVHERYAVEPLAVVDLNTQGYSWLRYARGPFRIGFFRLRALRSGELPEQAENPLSHPRAVR